MGAYGRDVACYVSTLGDSLTIKFVEFPGGGFPGQLLIAIC